MEKTGEWKLSPEAVNTVVSNNYDLELISQKTKVIAAEISKIFGRPLDFKVRMQSVEVEASTNAPVEIPVQVKIIVDAFKGSIVAGKQ